MDQTHQYDCIVCGAHFENSKDLSRHNEDQHLRSATGMERPRDPDSRKQDEEDVRELYDQN